MEWRFSGNAPIYAQLVEQLTQRIVTAVYPPGQRIPPVRELAMEAGVNPNTMQRALGELERQGLVFSQRTSGRFVTEDTARIEHAKRSLAEERISSFLRAMEELGLDAEAVDALLREARERDEKNDADS